MRTLVGLLQTHDRRAGLVVLEPAEHRVDPTVGLGAAFQVFKPLGYGRFAGRTPESKHGRHGQRGGPGSGKLAERAIGGLAVASEESNSPIHRLFVQSGIGTHLPSRKNQLSSL